MKVVAMIPARVGSKRIKKKNLRYLNNKPLISWIVESALQSGVFEEIYLNTDAPEPSAYADLAQKHGIKYYQRPTELGSDEATNDEFLYDFLVNHECDYVVQLLPTSPFLKPKTIRHAVEENVLNIKEEDFEFIKHIVSVKTERISANLLRYSNRNGQRCLVRDPLNYDNKKFLKPSQELYQIELYACGLMGWHKKAFLKDFRNGCGYYGGTLDKAYVELSKIEAIDIDNEEDFELAEAVAFSINRGFEDYATPGTEYYKNVYEDTHDVEVHVPSILERDGIQTSSFAPGVQDNFIQNAVQKVKDDAATNEGSSSWRVVNSLSNSATFITQQPGEGNRMHYHPEWDEWWLIIDGRWEYTFINHNNKECSRIAKEGDIVFLPRGTIHKIVAVGDKPATRLAVSRADVPHVYVEQEGE